MTNSEENLDYKKKITDEICEECKRSQKSVLSNLIMHGFKICDSCKISKTIFPI